ncbi:MAG: AmmeMemoRadiSam system protein A [Syntrophobacteraceae bacterium]|nr:AmmeMemoRadiSam system protein A [Syntrophobacteraceae bacterium]
MVDYSCHECEKDGVGPGFSAREKEQLRAVAFEAIRCRCLGQDLPEITVDAPRLQTPGGAFVCIHKGKELRGCIGMIEAQAPLWETVRRMAVEAAFKDPRFCAVSPNELDGIDIEISVLTPMRRIGGLSEIEIGKHGLLIRKGYLSGLLLPQVATEHHLDGEGFLQWTCHKAGLTQDGWKDKEVEIYVFSADVF